MVLIAGSSARDKWLGWIAREQIKPYEERVQFEYWEGPTPEEARERLKGLSADTIVCYIVEYSDHLGRSYSGLQYLEKIVPHTLPFRFSALCPVIWDTGQSAVMCMIHKTRPGRSPSR